MGREFLKKGVGASETEEGLKKRPALQTTPPAEKQELGGGLPFHRWAWAAGLTMVRGLAGHGGIR